MPINVVCPGCFKRFQVSEKFAGKKGPCPNCQAIIEIPKEQVVVHAPEEFVSGGKTIKGRAILKPITRLNTNFEKSHIIFSVVGIVVVLTAAVVLGKTELGSGVRNLAGMLGLLLISFPLVLFGYQVLREGDELEPLQGTSLLGKSAICGLVYSVLWIAFEGLAKYMDADNLFIWVYLLPFLFLSILAVHVLFDFDFGRGFLHYLVFLSPLVILRGLAGLGWIWNVAAEVTGTGGGTGPPPPPPGLG